MMMPSSLGLTVPLGDESSHFSDNASTGHSSSTGRDGGESTTSTMGGHSTFGVDGVKRDNLMVTLVRAAVMGILLVAAILSSYYAFRITRDAQLRTFHEAFDGVATKMAPGLLSDLSLRMWQASTLAAAVKTKFIDQKVDHHLLNFDSDSLYDITQEARTFSGVDLMGWSPLLRTEQERVEFEQMAAASVGPSTTGGNPVCYICEPTHTMEDPDWYMNIPGVGPTSCGELELAGLSGLIPEATCPLMTALFDWGCACIEGAPAALDENVSDGSIPRATQVSGIDEESGFLVPRPNGTAPYLPLWNIAGATVPALPIMLDQLSISHLTPAIDLMIQTNLPMFSETVIRQGPFYEKYTGHEGELSTTLLYPVEVDQEIVGSVSFDLLWTRMITTVIPGLSEYIHVVIENTLDQNFTFGVDPELEQLVFLGEGDLHDPAFDSVVLSSTFDQFTLATYLINVGEAFDPAGALHCRYRFHVFAKQELMDLYVNSDPIFYCLSSATIFVFTSLVFILYDFLVRRVQRKVVASAKHTTAIVTSLFPKNVRDRLLQQAAEQSNAAGSNSDAAPMRVSKMRMQNFLVGGSDEDNVTSTFQTDPIADLFASATVMFLDIVSFTAWSSEREPSQVFILLETIYQSFDQLAAKLGVFKVETIGDSYVAVCGLPTRREGHAPVMAKFAQRCLAAMKVVTKDLEVRLGPSTGELRARVGLHSGPVTAGVMRGEKARFQLFGDTVNTASRLESSGMAGCIHVSQACADLLEKAGKGHWALKRENLVSMKGKGDMQTYFLKSKSENESPSSTRMSPGGTMTGGRLVEWNTEIIFEFLKRIVLNRQNTRRGRSSKHAKSLPFTTSTGKGNRVIDELTQTLCLPTEARSMTGSTDQAKVPFEVKGQLHTFVKRISEMYRDVPFHNFEHCSHVLMSTSKLMKRIVNPDDIDYKQTDDLVAIAIHQSTYGISSDPILQFASLFAALIHDVDHTGLTNAELIDEKAPLASTYRNQSVAEQNSVDLAWNMLMEPAFKELRKCIYQTEDELVHFRQLVVNAVMATDIADKQLKQARERRWAETFPAESPSVVVDDRVDQRDRDRKATIVFEYIIQASDVCHTMQHWHTYQKFNKRLFEERYVAWLSGNLKKEPWLGWYGGELWFFDNYIIPMAQKLDKCGVFGVSYHEYLTYAKENRIEWERKGKGIVDEMKAHCDRKYSSKKMLRRTSAGRESSFLSPRSQKRRLSAANSGPLLSPEQRKRLSAINNNNLLHSPSPLSETSA